MEMTSVTNVLRRICCWIYSVGKAYGQQSKRKAVDEMISCQDDCRPIFSEPYTIVGGDKQICIGRNFISQPGLKIECIDSYAGNSYWQQRNDRKWSADHRSSAWNISR